MKKMIISALCTALFLFVYQFLSWAMLGLHKSNMVYTPHQDEILANLEGKLQPGEYMLPGANPALSNDELNASFEKYAGKPWARIEYHNNLSMSMTMSMIRGFAANLVAGLLLFWLLSQITNLDMKKSIIIALTAGTLGYLTTTYVNGAWFEKNTLPDLLDVLISWVGAGAITGFFAKNKNN